MNAVESIVKWAADKPTWWQLAIKITLQGGTLSRDNIKLLFDVAQSEYGLIPKHPNYNTFTSPIDIAGFASEEYPVRLKMLSNVEGVAALAEQQNLAFKTDGLTIVYGDNGAGKSSYTSILKHACLTRGTLKPISSNVFTSSNKTPQALITVQAKGSNQEILWSSVSKSNNDAKSIRVFDTSSAHHYLSNEDSLGYKPVGISLLTELTKAAESIKNIIDEDIMGNNGFISIPPRSPLSSASIFVNQLSALSTEQEIDIHCATQDEIDSIEIRKTELATYKAQSPAQIKTSLLRQKQIISPLVNFFTLPIELLSTRNFDLLKGLEIDYNSKQAFVDKLRLQTLSDLPFTNICNTEWNQLWTAAKVFIQKENKDLKFPPVANDSCPLCLQHIGIDTADKLQEFESFIQNNAAKGAGDALKALTTAKKSISELNLNIAQYEAALSEVDNIKNGLKGELEQLANQLIAKKALLIDKKLPEVFDTIITSSFKSLTTLVDGLQKQIDEIDTNDTHTVFITEKEATLIELQDREYVSQNKVSILSNIKRHKTVAALQKIKSECNTRSISKLSSSIFSAGVIEPLKAAFQAELDFFGFNRFTVNVCSRNKAGHQQFKLELADSNESVVAKVASEGEQRCIAIASFLAEMKADSRDSAVIFDDPVNSLSHQWSARVAGRLVNESLGRQVIVFTHDIVFYKLLLESSEKLSQDKIGYISLERSRAHAGIVRSNPPWDALTTSKRIGVLRTKLQKLRQLDLNGTETEFRDATRPFYSLLREAWERLVEEKLLNKVVNRFERGVQMQRLTRLDDITQEDFDLIDLAYGKCCNDFTGHDTATAVGHPYPTIDEVATDLDTLNDYLQSLQTKRKRS